MVAEPGYDALMHDVCVVWGFCGCRKDGVNLHVDLLIPSAGRVTADQFVEWVFLAENLNPKRWEKQKAAIRDAFVRHMGAETVDARRLQWSNAPPDDIPDQMYREPIPDTPQPDGDA
jgi:hypothetical protein